MRLRAIDRRMHGLTAVQKALAELRAVGSVDLMLTRCAEVVCRRCGFDRSVLFRIEDDVVVATSAFARGDLEFAAKVKHFAEKIERPVLNEMLLETEMFLRREPAIVHDALHDPRTFKPLLEVSDVHDAATCRGNEKPRYAGLSSVRPGRLELPRDIRPTTPSTLPTGCALCPLRSTASFSSAGVDVLDAYGRAFVTAVVTAPARED
jgi:hypothetical protein